MRKVDRDLLIEAESIDELDELRLRDGAVSKEERDAAVIYSIAISLKRIADHFDTIAGVGLPAGRPK